MVKIENCNLTGVSFDPITEKTINMVAEALLNLTTLFKNQNVQLESMIKIEQTRCQDVCQDTDW